MGEGDGKNDDSITCVKDTIPVEHILKLIDILICQVIWCQCHALLWTINGDL